MRHHYIWHVRIVIRLDNNHLVTGINQPQDRGEDPLSRPCSDDNSADDVDIQIVEACCVIDDSLAQRCGSRTGGVLVMQSGLSSLYQERDDIWRRVEVRLPLTQIQCVVLLCQ